MITSDDVVLTSHQLNFLHGCSVIERVRQADIVLWLDETQFERHSFVNRNRLTPDGVWLTIPINEQDHFAPINRVRIADPTGRARAKVARTLELTLGEVAAPFALERTPTVRAPRRPEPGARRAAPPRPRYPGAAAVPVAPRPRARAPGRQRR